MLEQGDHADIQRLAFQVAPGTDLADVTRTLVSGVSKRSGITPGIALRSCSRDPEGTFVEIYSDYRFHAHGKSEGGNR